VSVEESVVSRAASTTPDVRSTTFARTVRCTRRSTCCDPRNQVRLAFCRHSALRHSEFGEIIRIRRLRGDELSLPERIKRWLFKIPVCAFGEQ
jgi:hypothetical protein